MSGLKGLNSTNPREYGTLRSGSLDRGIRTGTLYRLGNQFRNAIHKRTRAYSINDFHLLKEIISNFEEMKVIPNAPTEASSLLSFEGEGLPAKLFAAFSRLLETAEEIYIPSSDALRRGEFRRLGLGDAAILETGKADCHILSADVGLYLAAVKAGYKASNFTHAIEAARV